MSTNQKRSVTTVDSVERGSQRQLNDGSVTVSTGERPGAGMKYLNVKHPAAPHTSTVSSRTASRTAADHQAAGSPSGTGGRYRAEVGGPRGKRRPVLAVGGGGGVDRGSDSDTRRRDERVRFADNTVVQTADGRAVIVDDSALPTSDRQRHHAPRTRRSLSISGTLPARLHGGHSAGARRALPEVEHRDAATDGRRSTTRQRVPARTVSAVYDYDDDEPRLVTAGGVSAASRIGSVPMSINVLHRATGNSPKYRELNVVQPVSARRGDTGYYRDASSSARLYRR